jgi:2-dehydro-3-deoxygalactonokinase
MIAAAAAAGTPRLIALDWGSSSLRAFLLGDGAATLAQRHDDWGILRLPPPGGRAGFERVFAEVAGPWLRQWPGLPAVACGMVGSAQGWQEAPYVPCPADARALAAHAVRVAAPLGAELWLAPGLRFDPPAGAPDVMRGEEIQVAGALELQPQWAERACFVLPGTHSKWAQVEAGRLVGFATHMTGELFAVLRQHSILGRLMPARTEAATPGSERRAAQDAAFDASFVAGVRAARASTPGELGHQLFAVRTLGLTGGLAPELLGDYLSGLLIGHELVAGLAASGRDGAAPLVLVGDPTLCRRYAQALEQFGARAGALLDNTAPRGLWAFARAAGLLPTA